LVREVIDVKRSLEFVAHIRAPNGDDFSSDNLRSWAPAYENYTFSEKPGGTELRVSVDVVPEYERYMLAAFPKALERLEALCERGATP